MRGTTDEADDLERERVSEMRSVLYTRTAGVTGR